MYISKTRHLLYITDISHDGPSGRMEHLSCFFPGLIALGLHILPDSIYKSADEKLLFQYAAEGLAHTCWVLYADQATGVGPDEVVFEPYGPGSDEWESGRWIDHMNEWIEQGKPEGKLKGVHNLAQPRRGNTDLPLDYKYQDSRYLMRPEVCLVRPNAVWRSEIDAADRPLSPCTLCGGPLVTRYGENEDGRCSKVCKGIVLYREAGWPRLWMFATPHMAC